MGAEGTSAVGALLGVGGLLEAFAHLLEDSPVGFCLLDAEMRYLAVNRELARLNGVPAEEHLGRTIAEVLPWVPPADYAPHFARALLGQPVGPVELSLLSPDGPGRMFEESWYPVRGDDGATVVAVAAVVLEVTERRWAEAGRVQALERLEALQEITAALAAARTRLEVARVIVDLGIGLVGAVRGSVHIASEDGSRLEGLVVSEVVAPVWRTIPADADLPAWEVVRQGRPLVVRSAAEAVERWPLLADLPGGPVGFFGLPLVVGHRVGGVLVGVLPADTPPLGVAELRLLVALADQFNVAFTRATLFDSERRGRKRMKRLRAFAAALARATTTDDVARALVAHGVTAAGATSAALVMADPETGALRVAGGSRRYARPGELWGPLPDDAPAAQALRRREPELIRSVAGAGRRFPGWRWLFEETAQQSWAFWPLEREPGALLALGYPEPQRFTREQRRQIETFALQCQQALERATTYEAQAAIAIELQQSMLPAALPAVPGVSWDAVYSAAADWMEVGGDWYDAVPYANGAVVVSVGDVVGHGLAAAAAMARIRNAIAAHVAADVPLDRIPSLLDRLVERSDELDFTTLALCRIGRRRRSARICLAGHPPPLVLRPGRPPAYLQGAASPPLAVGDLRTRPVRVRLEPGLRLVLYTDGLVERRGRTLDEGFEVLRRAVVGLPEEAPAHAIVERLRAYHGGSFADDVVVLVVTIEPESTDA